MTCQPQDQSDRTDLDFSKTMEFQLDVMISEESKTNTIMDNPPTKDEAPFVI